MEEESPTAVLMMISAVRLKEGTAIVYLPPHSPAVAACNVSCATSQLLPHISTVCTPVQN